MYSHSTIILNKKHIIYATYEDKDHKALCAWGSTISPKSINISWNEKVDKSGCFLVKIVNRDSECSFHTKDVDIIFEHRRLWIGFSIVFDTTSSLKTRNVCDPGNIKRKRKIK